MAGQTSGMCAPPTGLKYCYWYLGSVRYSVRSDAWGRPTLTARGPRGEVRRVTLWDDVVDKTPWLGLERLDRTIEAEEFLRGLKEDREFSI